MNIAAPRWDLSNIYPGLDSAEFEAALADLKRQIEGLEGFFKEKVVGKDVDTPVAELSLLAGQVIQSLNSAYELNRTIGAYINGFFSTNSHDLLARRRLSEHEQISLPLTKLATRFQAWVGRIAPALEWVIAGNPQTQAHAFMLRETAEQSRYLMSEVEEDLAAELSLSGYNPWERLQVTITSQLNGEVALDGEVQKLPLSAIINLRNHPEEAVRRRACETEMSLCASMREPLAACLNGIKGTANTLDRRRGRQDALHSSIDDSRIDRETLEAMLSAMHDSFPFFREYFRTKARRLGKQKLAWWDLFAPSGASQKNYTYEEARRFIMTHFASFSADLAVMAERAFENHWIDGEMRDGKAGGAFCMGIPSVKESRVFFNFDGSLDSVSTLAHELGHGFHNDCLYRAGKTYLQRITPMTLAETASILCETIINQAVLTTTSNAVEELAILENMLINDSQVVVDIYSRYLFEKEVFERREQAELSADDFCEIMSRAQQATYGDGLDEQHLNPYMWAWKPHYYIPNLSFYNYPYTFGLLFGIGLYAVYQQRGSNFVSDYQDLLASTGEGTAADLAMRFGIDIRHCKFWEDSLGVIRMRVERYCQL